MRLQLLKFQISPTFQSESDPKRRTIINYLMLRLVIIDGNAILHRAYHALPPLTNTSGQPINAVYGFISMLFRIKENLQPSHLLVCFDRPEPTFRKQLYVGYQAQRPKMDEELISQIDLLKKAVTAMHVPMYELAGYEADDIIGSLAFQAKNQKISDARSVRRYNRTPYRSIGESDPQKASDKNQNNIEEIIIVTGDRDMLQLVDTVVKVYMPIQGLTVAKLYGEQEVLEKFGVTAQQMIDYKALVGDASDNYPGVKGIGPKTASSLLQRYGTLEALYQAIEKRDAAGISEKVAAALSQDVNEAGMAKKLAAITTDVPITLDMEASKLTTFNTLDAQVFFEEMGFKSLEKRLTGTEKKASRVKKDEQLSLA